MLGSFPLHVEEEESSKTGIPEGPTFHYCKKWWWFFLVVVAVVLVPAPEKQISDADRSCS